MFEDIVRNIFKDWLLLYNVTLPFENLHYLCRSGRLEYPIPYPTDDKNGQKIIRPYVPDEKVKWEYMWEEYSPIEFTTQKVLSKPIWADPQDLSGIKFNNLDGSINRKSYLGNYELNSIGRPLNPIGRTGITGRGRLGKWGPNHAADTIVTRWKIDEEGIICRNPYSDKKILEFISICRTESKQWAIPGGMCDSGELITDTLKREFLEEATNSLHLSEEKKNEIINLLKDFFNNGEIIYSGYVDDPRNTDNAWMETIACNFHDETGTTINTIKLTAGDDASNVKWVEINDKLKLYASHNDFIREVAIKHDAHWSEC